jgi:hypothetical protein
VNKIDQDGLSRPEREIGEGYPGISLDYAAVKDGSQHNYLI